MHKLPQALTEGKTHRVMAPASRTKGRDDMPMVLYLLNALQRLLLVLFDTSCDLSWILPQIWSVISEDLVIQEPKTISEVCVAPPPHRPRPT